MTGRGTPKTVRDYGATLSNKQVEKAILRAWNREISDRYLDYEILLGIESKNRFRSTEEAYNKIRQNVPARAVKFLYNELARTDQSPTLFGRTLDVNMIYNKYSGNMLAWDDKHLFSLIRYLSRLNDRL